MKIDLIKKYKNREKYFFKAENVCLNCTKCECSNKFEKMGIKYDPHIYSNWEPSMVYPTFMIVNKYPKFKCIDNRYPMDIDDLNYFKSLLRGWDIRNFYITNLVKCYNNDPNKYVDECIEHFKIELAIVNPVLVIALGSFVFNNLCVNLKFSNNVGKVVKSNIYNIDIFPMYYPSKKNDNRNSDSINNLLNIIYDHLTPF